MSHGTPISPPTVQARDAAAAREEHGRYAGSVPLVSGKRPPRRPSIPLLGDTAAIVTHPYAYAQNNFLRYGYAWETWFMLQRAVVVVGEEIHRLFAQEPGWFSNHAFYQFLEAVLGVNLLSMSESLHADYKPPIARGLSWKQEDYLPVLNAVLQDELGRLPNAGEIDFAPIARQITFRIGAQLALGLTPDDPRFQTIQRQWADLRGGIYVPAQLRLAFPGSAWSRSQHARRHIVVVLMALIAECRTAMNADHPGASSLSHHYGIVPHLLALQQIQRAHFAEDAAALTAGSPPKYSPGAKTVNDLKAPMDDGFICDQLLSVLFASDDTTSGVLAWLLTHVALEHALQQQLASVFDQTPGAPITADDLHTPLVNATIQENSRLHHIASMIGRKVEQAFPYYGVEIPAGVLILSMTGYTQRMEQYFTDPTRFRPERFLPGGEGFAHPNALFTFGGGTHGCLGTQPAKQELAGSLIYFVRRWSFRLVGAQTLPASVFLPSGRPAGAVRLALSPRR